MQYSQVDEAGDGEEVEEPLPRPPRGRSVLDLTVIRDPDFASPDAPPPRVVINGQEVDPGYGRLRLEVPAGYAEVTIGSPPSLSFSVQAPSRRIRPMEIWWRPDAARVPVAVHCSDGGKYEGGPSCLRFLVVVVIIFLVIRTVVGQLS